MTWRADWATASSRAFQTRSGRGALSRRRTSITDLHGASRPTPAARGPARGPRLRACGTRALGEEVLAEDRVEPRVLAPNPLQDHGRVLLLLVPVVGQDAPQLDVLGSVDPLLVPVDRLQLLHEAHEGPMHVARPCPEMLLRLPQPRRTP